MYQDVNCEPTLGKIPVELTDEEKWSEVVDFLRKNPKLMLQMMPDGPVEEAPKLPSQVDEEVKWQKLQALSK